jgi:phosphoglycolate phosphatase-like HAD superfamily hydrolase
VRAVAIDLDGALGDTRPLWRDWLADASRRFAAIAPLEVDSLPEDRTEAAAALDRWAETGIGDWRAALERYAADRAPVYLRPNAEASGALRRLEAAGVRLGAFTDAPEALARVAATQLGAARRLELLMAGTGALERLLAQLGPEATIVRTREELLDLGSG